MRKFYYLALVALVGIALSSCSLFGGGGGGSNDPEFRLGDLQGLWQRNNTKEFIRFTTEQSEESPYLLGYEWDEKDWDDPDMTAEEFLLSEREHWGKPGNGWFKYWFETNKLAYALSDTIAVFQNESADSDTFIRNLITRANPYLLGGK